eukprot:357091-Chlamydomonas_euryale.AAC.4
MQHGILFRLAFLTPIRNFCDARCVLDLQGQLMADGLLLDDIQSSGGHSLAVKDANVLIHCTHAHTHVHTLLPDILSAGEVPPASGPASRRASARVAMAISDNDDEGSGGGGRLAGGGGRMGSDLDDEELPGADEDLAEMARMRQQGLSASREAQAMMDGA